MTMTKLMLAATAAAIVALPVQAQDVPKPFTVSGSVALVSDYRFRGVSQSDRDLAVQGGLTVTHASGFYAATWASNLAGWGTFGGSNTELDLVGGFKTKLGGGAIDLGLTWYMYPGGAAETDFAEPYAKLSGTIGPLNLLAGVAYAPTQQALGKWYRSGASASAGVYDDAGDKEDNLYLWGDASLGLPNTPLTVRGHIGHSSGNSGLGPNGTSVAPTGKYWDWLAGVDYVLGPVTLGVAYVDTDISKRRPRYLYPNFSTIKDGKTIAGSTILLSVGATF